MVITEQINIKNDFRERKHSGLTLFFSMLATTLTHWNPDSLLSDILSSRKNLNKKLNHPRVMVTRFLFSILEQHIL